MSRIRGWVDYLGSDGVKGWALIEDDPRRKAEIIVKCGNKIIATSLADAFRKDLQEKYGGDGSAGFDITFKEPVADLNSVVIIALDPLEGSQCVLFPLSKDYKGIKRGYQTFNDQLGDSDSVGKLMAIKLPPSLKGCKVLDLGCNEGFFCLEALRRGASRVVGLDINPEYIRRARERTNSDKVVYLNCSWWDIPEEQFDYILFLSALHYEPNPREFFKFLLSRLKPSGILILECGVVPGEEKMWIVRKRWDGFYRYPTYGLLVDVLLSDYAVKHVGKSVDQPGDPVPREAFHCRRKRSIYLLVSGEPGIGKTNVTSPMKRRGITVYSTDTFFKEVTNLPEKEIRGDRVLEIIKHEPKLELKIGEVAEKIIKQGLGKVLASHIFSRCPVEDDFVVIEGHALGFPEIERYFVERLERLGFVWRLKRIDFSPGSRHIWGFVYNLSDKIEGWIWEVGSASPAEYQVKLQDTVVYEGKANIPRKDIVPTVETGFSISLEQLKVPFELIKHMPYYGVLNFRVFHKNTGYLIEGDYYNCNITARHFGLKPIDKVIGHVEHCNLEEGMGGWILDYLVEGPSDYVVNINNLPVYWGTTNVWVENLYNKLGVKFNAGFRVKWQEIKLPSGLANLERDVDVEVKVVHLRTGLVVPGNYSKLKLSDIKRLAQR